MKRKGMDEDSMLILLKESRETGWSVGKKNEALSRIGN